MPRMLAFLDPLFAPIDNLATTFRWEDAPMNHVAWPLVTAVVYVSVIWWMSPSANKRKQETDLARSKRQDLSQLPWRKTWTWPLVSHYVLLAAGSLVMLVGTLRELERRWAVDSGAQLLADASSGGFVGWPGRWLLCEYTSVDAVTSASPFAGHQQGGGEVAASGSLYFWSYVYYLSKWYELLDTVLELQRGAPPPSFGLHVYHHATVMFMSWLWLQERQSMQWIGLCFNTFVHVVMYTYYALSRSGYRVSWKTLVTGLQVVQFGTSLAAWVGYLALHLHGPAAGVSRAGQPGVPSWAAGLGDAAGAAVGAVVGVGSGAVAGTTGGVSGVGMEWLVAGEGQCAGGWAVVFNLAFNVTLLHGFIGILAKAMCGAKKKKSKPEDAVGKDVTGEKKDL